MSRETWTNRDYPVLVAAAEHLDRTMRGGLQAQLLAEATGLDVEDVRRAMVALIPTHLTGNLNKRMAGPPQPIVGGITERGRREAGLWPQREEQLASLLAVIASAAESAPTEEERSRWRKIGAYLGEIPRQAAAGTLGAWAASQLP